MLQCCSAFDMLFAINCDVTSTKHSVWALQPACVADRLGFILRGGLIAYVVLTEEIA